MIEQYGERYKDFLDQFVVELMSEKESDDIDYAKKFKHKLREMMGKDEFIRIFKEAYQYYKEHEKQYNKDDWYWKTNFPAVKAVLFPLEANQLEALRQLDYFWYIESGQAKTLEDCRIFIDEKLGLRNDHAEFMARCGWEVCSPYYNK